MEKSTIRVLVVDDYEPWRRRVRSMLTSQAEFEVVAEVPDGLEAIEKAQQLQPDLIFLDIGLPKLNGIEVARRVCELAPQSKILFVSENRSPEIAEEALRTGASGYLVKLDSGTELFPAIKAVLQGERFVSARIVGHRSTNPLDENIPSLSVREKVITLLPGKTANTRHEVAFYPDDSSFVDGFARFIEDSLKMGNVVILLVTEPHRAALFKRLRSDGVDVDVALDEGRLAPLDVADTLPRLMVADQPDPVLCANLVGGLVGKLSNGPNGEHSRVVACGECAPTLLAEGKAEAAVQLEHLWDELAKAYKMDTLCGYSSSRFPIMKGDPIFKRVCAEHSAVHAGTRDR